MGNNASVSLLVYSLRDLFLYYIKVINIWKMLINIGYGSYFFSIAFICLTFLFHIKNCISQIMAKIAANMPK